MEWEELKSKLEAKMPLNKPLSSFSVFSDIIEVCFPSFSEPQIKKNTCFCISKNGRVKISYSTKTEKMISCTYLFFLVGQLNNPYLELNAYYLAARHIHKNLKFKTLDILLNTRNIDIEFNDIVNDNFWDLF